MAKILTFRNKDDASSNQSFLTDENQTLSFRTTEDGGVSLGNLSQPGLPELFPDPKKDWSNQELADLFRVRQLLNGANVAVETDRGITDEGDPWFVFCHANGDVFIHLCRIDGRYLLDSPNVRRPLCGASFNELIADFTNQALPAQGSSEDTKRRVIKLERGGKVRLHPSALLAALIWTLFLASEELVLLAPDEQAMDDDDLLDFDGLLAVDSGEAHEIDVLLEDNTTDIAALLTDDGDVEDHATPDTHGQLREAMLLQQQGLTVQNNAFTMGLSTIAIAMGFMSETVLLENQRKVLESLKELGFSEYGTDTIAVAELDIPANSEGNELLAMLADFLGLDLSLNTNVADTPATQAERAQLKADLAALPGESASEATLPVANKITPETFQGEKADGDETHVELAEIPVGNDAIALEIENNDTLTAETEQDTTILTLSQIVQNLQTETEEFQLGQTTVDASALFDVINTSYRQGTEKWAFDEMATRLVQFLEAKDGDIGLIEFGNQIIMVDRTATTGGETDFIQWEAADGRTISFIGLAADFEAFDMIA